MSWTRGMVATVLLVTAYVVQVTALSRLGLPGATPDLVLLVVVALALQWGPESGVVIGFGAGLLQDLAPPADGPLARWSLALALVGFVVGAFREDAARSLLVPLGAVAGSAVVGGLVVAAVGALVGEPGTTWSSVLTAVPSAVLYDVALSPFVVPATLALASRTDPEHDSGPHR